MLVRDEGGDLIGGHVFEDVEAGGDLVGDPFEDFLGFARSDGPFEGCTGEVGTPLADPLTSHQVLLELLQRTVDDVAGQILEAGDRLGDLLDLVVSQVFHHLTRDFLPQGDHDDGDFFQ